MGKCGWRCDCLALGSVQCWAPTVTLRDHCQGGSQHGKHQTQEPTSSTQRENPSLLTPSSQSNSGYQAHLGLSLPTPDVSTSPAFPAGSCPRPSPQGHVSTPTALSHILGNLLLIIQMNSVVTMLAPITCKHPEIRPFHVPWVRSPT